jgi:hypothetical protein
LWGIIGWQGGEERFPVTHFDSLIATLLETPKKSSTYLRAYTSGFFVVSAALGQNSKNAHNGNFFHRPAGGNS